MRSSRSGADPLDPGPAGFAHRGFHDGAARIENSRGAVAAALERGMGIECDLRLTADDQIIVFHDRDAMRVCGSPAVIAQCTQAELSDLRVGGEPILTLRQLLSLVGGRVPLLLEAKIDDRVQHFGPALLSALGDYWGPFGVMSFDPRLLRWLKTNSPHIRRGLVLRERLSPARRWGLMMLADPQFIAVDRAALSQKWIAGARGRVPVYAWTIRTGAERRAAAPLTNALIWEADGRPRS